MTGDFARWLENETTAALTHDRPPQCPECEDTCAIWFDTCTCGSGGEFPHERYCGAEPCPRGCPFVAPSIPSTTAGEE